MKTIKELISAITLKHKKTGIDVNRPASLTDIQNFEKIIGFSLPDDFVEFYSICDGFGCVEDIFNFVSLSDITKYKDDFGKNWFGFAEYMIYSDMWSLRKTKDNTFEIINTSEGELILTTSLHEFLERFSLGNVFDPGGLYDWQKELKQK